MSPNTTGLAEKCRIFVIDKATVVYTYQAATILCDRYRTNTESGKVEGIRDLIAGKIACIL